MRRPQCAERRVAFVINATRVRHLDLLTARCRAAAAATGWEALLAETTRDDHGRRLARGAISAGARLVFAAGGDGTVSACADAVAGTGVPLAIIPLGTANLAARALGIPRPLDAALATGFSGLERRIDLARADGATFAAMAGIGVDAAVVAGTPAWLKDRLGWAAYALSGAAHMPGRRTGFTIRLDGGEPRARRARCVVVGNAGVLPGGFILLPRARLDDGLLDVGILAPSSPAGWARIAYRVLAGRDGGPAVDSQPDSDQHDDSHRDGAKRDGAKRDGAKRDGAKRDGAKRDAGVLERHQARRVEITADALLPCEIDGEPRAPVRSLTVAIRRGALLVRVPPADWLAN